MTAEPPPDDAAPATPAPARLRPTRPVKRSFTIAGHRTSVSLEAAFWDALVDVAARSGRSQASIIQHIDRTRGDAGLSSAIRVYLLNQRSDRPR
jgi:predicted DNA-binding ribbon-helix-helix protein